MKKQYNFAIIGCGHIAQRHAKEASKFGVILAVCDVIESKARALAEQYQCRYYINLDTLLANEPAVDIISICTPNYLHAPQSIQCLENKRHVLCEKPMALNMADAEKMIQAAKSSDKKLFIVKQNRYNPPVSFVKKLIDNNQLGKIYSFLVTGFWNRPTEYYHHSDWKGDRIKDGGTVFTQFSHFVDLINWFFGGVKNAQSLLSNFAHPDIDFEDTGVVNLEMENGTIGSFNFTVNSYGKNMEGSITIFAEKGTIKIGGQYLNELEYFLVKNIGKPELPIGNGANNYGFYQGSMSNHDKIYENIIKALEDENHPFLQGDEAIYTIEIIEKIYNSKNPVSGL
ncbi:MAG TPA: Gfo/Idh/MocA family oxidoreductase [Niabella sp.]|jgi:UDP-N-acetyl-2-amino-2-deoxyglucuronate dehydrogenase|nr:Gfo/Idh/MocA family oxidoreductase [Chitinophagaceae bacterium]HRN47071.1 Gfo/Idh/MocA family oxidoreductase [Niabella sp.]HRO85080.1 Gfo/Idh/MocA family oxidoreductase [Niabella sp.]